MTDAELSDWWLRVEVKGGYTPHDSWMNVYQKGQRVVRIWLDWTFDEHHAEYCCIAYWSATFHLEEPICLDSNQYPDVWDNCWVDAEYETIPGKDVCVCFTTEWSGCEEPDQDFLVKSISIPLEKLSTLRWRDN